jgi:hypothetical protein
MGDASKGLRVVHSFMFVAIPVFILLEIGLGIVVGRALKFGRGETFKTE